MRPIKLIMSAFGPYAGVQELDMTRLGEDGLYAITGETGAGKTTIFDAIMYALYAVGSGEDRDGRNLRSDYADEKTETYVELTFSSAGKEYLIRRSPAQRLNGNRTEKPAKVVLQELPDGNVVTKADEASRRIREEIIGVDSAQFSQIVMIAQGEFRKLVRAKSKDRTEILRRIFKTEEYSQLARILNDTCKQKYGEYTDTRKEILSSVKNLRTLDCAEQAEDLEKLQGTKPEDLHIDAAVTLAREILTSDEDDHQRAADAKLQAETERDAAKAAYTAAKENDLKWKNLEEQQTKNAELREKHREQIDHKNAADAARPEIEALSGKIVTFTNLLLEYDKLTELDAKRKEAADACEAARRCEENTIRQLEKIIEEKQALLDEKEKLKNAAERKGNAEVTLRELTGIGEKLSALSERLKRQENAAKAAAEAEAEQKSAEENVNRVICERDNLQNELEVLGNTALAVSNCTEKLKQCNLDGEELKNRRSLICDWNHAESEYEQAKDQYLISKKEAEDLRNRAIIIRNRYNDNIAGILASELKAEQPCPVCGSVHHPKPAGLTEPVDRRQTEQADREAVSAENKANGDAMKCESAKIAADGLHTQILRLMPQIPDNEWNNIIGLQMTENAAIAEALTRELETVKDSDIRARKIAETYLPEAVLKCEEGLKRRRETDAAAAAARTVLTAEKAETDKAAAGLMPAEWDNGLLQTMNGDNQKQQEVQKNLIRQAEADLKRMAEIELRLQELESEKEKLNETLSTDRSNAAKEQERQENLRKQFRDIQNMLPFETKADAEAAVRRGTERRNELKLAIETAEAGLRIIEKLIAENEGRISTLEGQLSDVQKCDLGQLESAYNNAQAAYLQAEKTEREIYSRLISNRQQREILEQKAESADRIEREFRMMKDIADTVDGKISGQAKITLETYVQMAYFDRILSHANMRLRHMSREQYELRRRPVENAGTQGQTGLDLDVIDHYNGTVREVGTLSGGEGFLAALSLALGMSDTIQASSASAVRLDTMFVDEGFGSLSGSFLTLAMDELIDTAENGHRLIGIISHVEDVKSQLPRRIEVTKQQSGGSVAVIR